MSDVRLAQYGGFIFVVRTAMTPTQVEIVQDSFRFISRQPQEASRIFYEELFRLSPEIRDLFPTDLNAHKTKFVQMLSMIVKSLNQVARISEHVVDLGRRHMAYDVEDEHFPIVGEAFQAMLQRLLGRDLTPEVSEAWRAAYDMLARIMQEASVVPRTAEGFYGAVIRSVLTSEYGASIASVGSLSTRAPITHGIEHGRVLRFS